MSRKKCGENYTLLPYPSALFEWIAEMKRKNIYNEWGKWEN